MEPALAEGDHVLLAPLSGRPVAGDVVVVRHPKGGLFLHRVVRASGAVIITRGDACRHDDPAVAPSHVLFRAVGARRGGRTRPIPPPPSPLARLGFRLARYFASRLAARGRWWRARRCSSISRGDASWA